MSSSSLQQRISKDADFFDSMMGLLPSACPHTDEHTDNNNNSKYIHSKNVASARQSFKENSKSGMKAKAKYDPANYTSALQTNGKQQQQQQQQQQKKKKRMQQQADSDEEEEEEAAEEEDEDADEDEEEEDEEMRDSDVDDDAPAPPAAAKTPKNKPNGRPAAAVPPAAATAAAPAATDAALVPIASLSAPVGLDTLRQRLHERIAGLSQKRKKDDNASLRQKKRKREEEKKKREKNDKKPSMHRGGATHSASANDDDDSDSEQRPAKKSKQSANAHASSSAASNDGVFDAGDFSFSSFAPLQDPQSKSGSYSLAGKQQRKVRPSDEALLKKAQQFEARIAEMKATGRAEEAEQLVKQKAMQSALLKTQGVKVKDDVKLLKKSIKRDEKAKQRSRSEWADRVAEQKKVQDKFHADRIASGLKKMKGDRSKRGTTAESNAAAAEAGGGKDKKLTRKERKEQMQSRGGGHSSGSGDRGDRERGEGADRGTSKKKKKFLN